MKKEELRIGNYVKHKDGIYLVVNIESSNLAYLKDNDKIYHWAMISDISGVDIDSDWLGVFGFEVKTDNEHIVSYSDHRNFYICQSKEDDNFARKAGSWYVGEYWDKIEYIHELQNYYYWIGCFKNELGSNGGE